MIKLQIYTVTRKIYFHVSIKFMYVCSCREVERLKLLKLLKFYSFPCLVFYVLYFPISSFSFDGKLILKIWTKQNDTSYFTFYLLKKISMSLLFYKILLYFTPVCLTHEKLCRYFIKNWTLILTNHLSSIQEKKTRYTDL